MCPGQARHGGTDAAGHAAPVMGRHQGGANGTAAIRNEWPVTWSDNDRRCDSMYVHIRADPRAAGNPGAGSGDPGLFAVFFDPDIEFVEQLINGLVPISNAIESISGKRCAPRHEIVLIL
jgi:hypothetical protein